ncbi:MAG: hypothetical protein K2J62_05785 [Bacteroidales bacterium]|nr:hypothetical protein [Bacteroidales bacterium]
MKKCLIYISVLASAFMAFSLNADAQFREEAFTQTYNEPNDTTFSKDTSDKMFSFQELFGGVAHKRDVRIGTLFAGSLVLPGLSQIHNRDYWKLPVIYGGMGACAGFGGYYLHQYKLSRRGYEAALASIPEGAFDVEIYPQIDYRAKNTGTWLMVGAGLIYWASLMDGMACYKKDIHPHPGRATVYSIILPGLGQAYNGEYWKIPIYWGGMIASAHFLYTNDVNYKRFKRIHNEATSGAEYTGPVSGETAKYYRDVYRRYRDYSIVALAAVYLLQVIDANVFAYMHDFEVSEDISLKIEPAVIAPDNSYAIHSSTMTRSGIENNAIGLKIGLRF